MNKKIIGIIIGIVIVIAIIAFFIINRTGGNVGLNSSIQSENGKSAQMISSNNEKILVLYFSDTGNTQKLAKIISDQVGGDLRMIEPEKPYPTGQALFDYTKNERDNNERPKFKDLNINIEDYDTVFVGYPIWWYTLPMIMYTVFDEYDFSGKTIIPFNTHEGSGEGGTYSTIKQWEPNANVLEGLPIRGGDMNNDQTSKVKNWLKDLGFNEV